MTIMMSSPGITFLFELLFFYLSVHLTIYFIYIIIYYNLSSIIFLCPYFLFLSISSFFFSSVFVSSRLACFTVSVMNAVDFYSEDLVCMFLKVFLSYEFAINQPTNLLRSSSVSVQFYYYHFYCFPLFLLVL